MGWTGEYNVPRTYAEEKARVAKMYTWGNEAQQHRAIQVSNARPHWYIAVEVTCAADADTHPYIPEILPDGRKRFVAAAVLKVRYSAQEWTHKGTAETGGPTECTPPASLLALLSPLVPFTGDNPTFWAYNWRANARDVIQRKARRLVPGMILRAPWPLSFGDYGTSQRFRVIAKDKGSKRQPFQALDMGDMRVSLRPGTVIACDIE